MYETAYFGAGCFWNAELVYSKQTGVIETEVGWCLFDDDKGQVEVVKVIFDSNKISLTELIEPFWSTHDPEITKNTDNQYVERSILLPINKDQEKIMTTQLQEKKSENQKIKTSVSNFSSYKKAPEKDQQYYFK